MMNPACGLPKNDFKSHQIGRFLSKDHFASLQSLMTMRQFSNGEHLFYEEDAVEHMYFVKKGHVHVYKTTEEGKRLLIYILQEGDFFGEFGGFDTLKSSFAGHAVKESQVGLIAIRDLEELIALNGAFAVEFLKWMGLLQRTTESKFRDLLLYGKTGALASTLIRLSNTYGKATPEGIMLDIKLTNTDIANMIGTSRESVNRMLAAYKDEGALSFRNSTITIHDLQYFRKIVSCPDCPVEICRI